MGWSNALAGVEPLEDAVFDRDLVAEMERAAALRGLRGPLRFATPTFKEYETSELSGCSKGSFPAFSITGSACALNCEHCRTEILKPMIPALHPADLDRRVRDMIALRGLSGFLLSGGSDKRNEIRYERFFPVIEGLKREFPDLKIAVHSALLDRARAQAMAAAGVDTVMMDVIGAEATIREVYHLDRRVEDFEETLAALCETGMEVVPHVVIGLHFGRILGEARALDMIARHPVHSLVFVVIMPFYAAPGRFATPETAEVGRLFLEGRARVPDRDVLLGCARPAGLHKRVTDAYAVMAGLDGIAFPAEGAVEVARMIGRPFTQQMACCSMKETADGSIEGRGRVAPCAA
jgi:uncharacterized radical SAM superfamily protein